MRLGLDIGAASIGWALLRPEPDLNNPALKFEGKNKWEIKQKEYAERIGIVACGSFCFDLTEDAHSQSSTHGQSLNKIRGMSRRTRNRFRSRRARLKEIRKLFVEYGLLTDEEVKRLFSGNLPKQPKRKNATYDEKLHLGPWFFRKEGLKKLLPAEEWARAIYHIAANRGPRYVGKGEGANAPPLDKENTESGNQEAAGEKTEDKEAVKNTEMRKNAFDMSERLRHADMKQHSLALYLHNAKEKQQEEINYPQAFIDAAKRGYRRNRIEGVSFMALRDDLQKELETLFAKQREFRNPHASAEFLEKLSSIAFQRGKVQDVYENLVGECRFGKYLQDEGIENIKRTSASGFSFERFRLAQKIVNTKITTNDGDRSLTAEERETIYALCEKYSDIKFRHVRECIPSMTPEDKFLNLSYVVYVEDEGEGDQPGGKKKRKKKKKTAREKPEEDSFAKMTGNFALKKCLGEDDWQNLKKNPAALDFISEGAAFCQDMDSLDRWFEKVPASIKPQLSEGLLQNIRDAFLAGAFNQMRGTAGMCAEAARRLLPLIRDEGKTYDRACTALGWDHTHEPDIEFDKITNHRVRVIVNQGWQQIKAIIREYGFPERIILEMARDAARGPEAKKEINMGLAKHEERLKTAHEKFIEYFRRPPDPRKPEFLKFRLWLDQNHECLYSGQKIPCTYIITEDQTAVEIDHILPRSRSFDDSYHNLALVLRGKNQDKRNMTPYEWYESGKTDPNFWNELVGRAKDLKNIGKRKRRNLLIKDFQAVEEEYKRRHLHDTQHGIRVLMKYIKQEMVGNKDFKPLYEKTIETEEGNKHRFIFSRSAEITRLCRKRWGLEKYKWEMEKDEKTYKLNKNGKRIRLKDDRTHALDAIVTASIDEWLAKKIAKELQKAEINGDRKDGRIRLYIPPPKPWFEGWKKAESYKIGMEKFRQDVVSAYQGVFVVRQSSQRARGAAHGDTLMSIGPASDVNPSTDNAATADIKAVYKLVDVHKLTLKDIEGGKLRDARNKKLAEALTSWIKLSGEEKKLIPWPRMPTSDGNPGPQIKRIYVKQNNFSGISVARGHGHGFAKREGIVRVDLYQHQKNNKYYIIPIYRYQVANNVEYPHAPNRAIKSLKPESEWLIMDNNYKFMFSIYKNSLIEIQYAQTDIRYGYFRDINRRLGAISFSKPHTKEKEAGYGENIGLQTLGFIKKYYVDRLGRKHEIKQEKRTWRGNVIDG